MSKSLSRYISIGICYGSNTEFYRDRRKQLRRKNRQIIRNLLHNFSVDLFDDLFTDFRPLKKIFGGNLPMGHGNTQPKRLRSILRKEFIQIKMVKLKNKQI